MSLDEKKRHDDSHLRSDHDNISTVIARTALNHYNDVLPKKGKPTHNKEWTVYAAIVATSLVNDIYDCSPNQSSRGEKIRAWVVSSATGSKCTAINSSTSPITNLSCQPCNLRKSTLPANDNDNWKGMILHDSHAEVLARKGLIKVLWREIYLDLLKDVHKTTEDVTSKRNKDDNPTVLQRVCTSKNNDNGDNSKDISYQLNENMQLHMYISDSPCGDASIYDIAPEYNTDQQPSRTTYTGAKIIMPQTPYSTTNGERLDNFRRCGIDKEQIQIAREAVQVVSALRLKSGRSNLPAYMRSMSMSCSDKLCKWMVMGLQGSGLLSCFLRKSIILSTVVVSHDRKACIKSQQQALHRAIIQRANETVQVALNCLNDQTVGIPCLPLKAQVIICPETFPQSKSAADAKAIENVLKIKSIVDHSSSQDENPKKRKHDTIVDDGSSQTMAIPKKSTLSPSGMSINWQCCLDDDNMNSDVELIVGAKGIKQGKIPKDFTDFIRLSSRLSRHSLFFDSQQCIKMIVETGHSLSNLSPDDIILLLGGHNHHLHSQHITYQWTKTLATQDSKKRFKSCIFQNQESPLYGWVRSSEDHDFIIRRHP
mmetsp:Transcript_2870/g.5384  ORF Transcript_2870/g.5384 Transcript_2870/m.5384 type:complete len:596 (-) Transcript_2870:1157-2944(-)